jgi:ribosomal protein S27E
MNEQLPPVQTETAPGESRTFPCESCGGDLVFHIGAQSLKCPFCGAVKELAEDPQTAVQEQDFKAMLERLAEFRKQGDGEKEAEGFKEIRCEDCGATVRFEGTLTSRDCNYCGSPLQVEGAHQAVDRVPVDGVVPFQIDRNTAGRNLRRWIRSRWFAPTAFTKRGSRGKFDGTYLPYWTFDSMTNTRYTGQRGDHYWTTQGSGKKKRRVRHTRWRTVSGRFQQFFDDVIVVAAGGLPLKRVRALEPWPLDRCVPFDRGLLAGFLARTYDIELEPGFATARDKIKQALETEVRRRIGGDVQRISSMNTAHAAVTFKHLLLPLWMMAYRFKGETYQVVVNAATGEVQGDRPWSWIKIALASVAGAILVALIYYFVR